MSTENKISKVWELMDQLNSYHILGLDLNVIDLKKVKLRKGMMFMDLIDLFIPTNFVKSDYPKIENVVYNYHMTNKHVIYTPELALNMQITKSTSVWLIAFILYHMLIVG